MKLEEKIRQRLRDWVAEEELEGILDSELNKARQELQQHVSATVKKETQKRVEILLQELSANDEQIKKFADEVFAALLERHKEKLVGMEPKYKWGSRHENEPENVAAILKDKLEEAVSRQVDDYVSGFTNSDEAKALREKIAEDLIPKAAGFALSQLAESVISKRIYKMIHPDLVHKDTGQRPNPFGY